MKIGVIIAIVMFVLTLLKVNYIFRLERISGNFLIRKALIRSFFWWLPVIQKPKNIQEKKLILKANYIVAAFWGLFLIVIIIAWLATKFGWNIE